MKTNIGQAHTIGNVGDNSTTNIIVEQTDAGDTNKKRKTKKVCKDVTTNSISIKTSVPPTKKGWKIKATGITLIEPCEEPGIHIECNSTIKEVKDVSINMGKNGISMELPTSKAGATVTLSKNVKCGVELATSSSSVNMFL